MKLEQIEEEIKILQKEKEKELLRIEVEKLKKTVVEETTVIKRTVEKWVPSYPYYPIITYGTYTNQTSANL